MANQRIYNDYTPYDRSKLARNKYGLVNTSVVAGSTLFGGGSGSGNIYNQVGSSMANLSEFRGATRTEAGEKGLVPAPGAGMDEYYYLRGNGSWDFIAAAKWLHEFPRSEGLAKSGLEIDGNFNVTDTITTMNLEVQGAAHFWSLVIDEVKAQGGQVIVSPSLFKTDYVGEIVMYDIFDANTSPLIQLLTARTDVYNALIANNIKYVRCRRLWQRNDDGERAIENECYIGDMMRCRSFNVKADTYRNISNTDYWTFVVNTGEGKYTDDDNNEYDGFYIDLAFTLRDETGHNYPLGTTLYTDGTYTYPDGYTEITDALELKKVSQEMWDGTRDVDEEYFENAEWIDIQEKVLGIRGLDDQLADLTGRANTDSVNRSRSGLQAVEDSLNVAMTGDSVSNEAGGYINMISGNTALPYNAAPINEGERRAATAVVNSILNQDGAYEPANGDLTVKKKIKSTLVLAEDTITGRDFVAAADLYDGNTLEYSKGQTITAGTTVKGDWKVFDDLTEDEAFKKMDDDPEIIEITDEKEKKEIDDFPEDTSKGTDRDPEGFLKDVEDYPERTSWLFGYTSYYPQFRFKVGDNLACLGHLYDSERQNAIVLSSTNPIDPELQPPAIAQYTHLDTFGVTISRYRQTAIAANGNEFIGQFFVNYNNTYVDVNDRINMFITDLETGLENVGIHLDGEQSLIKLVGSVELRQHDQTNGDTLSVYDSLGRKKVEIIPHEVPSRTSGENPVDYSKLIFNTIKDNKNAGKNYINYTKWRDTDIPLIRLFFPWKYTYELRQFNIQFTTSIDLGYLEAGFDLIVNKMIFSLLGKTYLNGTIYVDGTNHGYGKQSITDFLCSLKCNGSYINAYRNINLKNTMEQPGNINGDVISVTHIGNAINIVDLPMTGSYTLEVTIGYNVYAKWTCDTEYPNYYYKINCGISGTCESSVTKMTDQGSNISKMTIGTDGLYFLGADNQKYVYMGDDGFDLNWGDSNYSAKISAGSNGLSMIPLTLNVSNTATVNSKYSLVVCAYKANGYTVTLPSITNFGHGREMTILGFPGLKVHSAANEYINVLNIPDAQEITFNTSPCISLKLIAVGNTWYGLSAL